MAPSIEEQVQFSLRCNFAMTLLMISVSGITLFMWLYMVSLYVETSPAMRKRRRPYLALSLVLFLLHLAADILWGLNIYSLLFEVTPGSGEYETFGDLVVKYDEKFGAPASLIADLALRLADAILLYRCYIIWTGRRWIIVVPVLIWLANLGINLRTYIPFDFWSDRLNAVDTLLIVILNVLLTGLIAFRLLRARKQLISALPTHDGAGRMYLGVLAILIESAAPIAISGVGLAVARLFVRDGGANWEANQALGVFQILSNVASPLCPQLILFRVAIGSSWANKKDTTDMMTRTMEFGTPEKTRSDEETGTELSSPS